ncbi:LGFP repeat-containing protein [Mycobacterium aquaticum]|uniref:Esterase n=1 Tax=Mycobacterium aquaticum TaxID=1927124 RepID=A0A1X0B2I8_9MYCO|nr:hypothetical protein [Mycobacterium aquaticum]ORA36537.1 hypothetical protein BST13_11450 [Mycobacterium aquaticum]
MQQTYLRFAGIIAVAATGALGVGCSNNSTGSGSETSRPASEATTGAESGTAAPGESHAPGAEGTATPGASAEPGAPGNAGTPGAPGAPGEPGAPGAPGAPGGPAPGAPNTGPADSTTIVTPNGSFVVQGIILQKYNATGGASSPLGLPTASEAPAPNGGQFSTFNGGAIYWTPQTGAHIVWGGIRDAWERDGGAGGRLGYPTSDEETIPGGWQSQFQHGTITYTDGQAKVEAR